MIAGTVLDLQPCNPGNSQLQAPPSLLSLVQQKPQQCELTCLLHLIAELHNTAARIIQGQWREYRTWKTQVWSCVSVYLSVKSLINGFS